MMKFLTFYNGFKMWWHSIIVLKYGDVISVQRLKKRIKYLLWIKKKKIKTFIGIKNSKKYMKKNLSTCIVKK